MKLKGSADKILSFAAFFPIVLLTLQIIIIGLGLIPHSEMRIISISISGLFMIPAIIIVLYRELKLFFITYVVIIFFVIFSYLFFPENTPYINEELLNLFLIIAPTFLCIASIQNLNDLKNTLNYISNIIFILGILYAILIFSQKIFSINYNMSYSYYLLLPTLFFSSQKKIISNIKVIILLLLMLLFGSRGPLFIGTLYFLISNTFFSKSIFLYSTIGLLLIFVLFVDFNFILLVVERYFGFSPRTLDFIINNNAFADTNRFIIFENIWKSILDGPILGRGLYSDRVVNNGAYSHNLFLEIMHCFGLFPGIIIITYLLWKTVYIYNKTIKTERVYFLLFFFYGFLPLLFTGSFLQHTWFAVYLGGISLFSKLRINHTTRKYQYNSK